MKGIVRGFSGSQCFIVLALLIVCAPAAVLAQSDGANRAAVALSLADAERMMLEKNRELQVARRAQESARADSMVAGQGANPTLTLQTLNINPSLGVGAGALREKTVDTTVRIDQLIERGEKRELRVAAAERLEAASDADFSEIKRQQGLVLRNAYYELALAQEKSAVLAETASLFEKSLAAADRRLSAGDIARAELARLRVDALRASNDARAAEADRSRAQIAFAYIVGMEADARAIRATDPWPQPEAAPAGGLSQELIARRPDVRAAQARVEAAERSRELARRLRTRDVTVGAQYEHWPQSDANQQGTGNSFGVAISIPLFVRHTFGGEIRRAEVDYDAARDSLARVRAQATGEFERAWSDLLSAADRVRRFNDGLLAEARRSAESAEYAYKNGALGLMDLLDARRTLRATQIDAAVALADYAKALAAWRASTTLAE
ncbi:MAG: TolC family protein [Betaproteobacteria bacterium]